MNTHVMGRPPRQTTLFLRVWLAPKPRPQYYLGQRPGLSKSENHQR
jgi:hypothetical protein